MKISNKIAKLGAGIFSPIFPKAIKDDFIDGLLSKISRLEAKNRHILKKLDDALTDLASSNKKIVDILKDLASANKKLDVQSNELDKTRIELADAHEIIRGLRA